MCETARPSQPAERPFASCLRVRGIEQPLSPRVGERCAHGRRSRRPPPRQAPLRPTPSAASSARSRGASDGHARRIPRRGTFARDLREDAMRDGADVPRRFARPIERQRRHATSSVGTRRGHAGLDRRRRPRWPATDGGSAAVRRAQRLRVASRADGEAFRSTRARIWPSPSPRPAPPTPERHPRAATDGEHTGEMQAALRACGADIEQPAELGAVLDVGQASQIPVDGIRLAATRLHRREQETARTPAPAQDFRGRRDWARGRGPAGSPCRIRDPSHGAASSPARAWTGADRRPHAATRARRRDPGQSGTSPATSWSSTSAKNRSAASRSIGSTTVAPPPSASHAPRTRAATPARPRASSARRKHRARRARNAPAPAATAPQSAPSHACSAAIEPLHRVSAASTTANRSGRVSPHHGARSTASQASRSAGWIERVRQRREILHRRPLSQHIEVDRGIRNARGAQRRQQCDRDGLARGRGSRRRLFPRRARVSTWRTTARASPFASAKTSQGDGAAGAGGTRRRGGNEAHDTAPRVARCGRARSGTRDSSSRRARGPTGNCAAGRCSRPAASPMRPPACASTKSLTSAPRKR